MKHRLCIISFSPVYRDGRVLRQIEYLSPHYDLTVIGYGRDPERPGIRWIPITRDMTVLDKVLTSLLLVLGRVFPPLYNYRYWSRPHYRQTREIVTAHTWDAFYANEWAALPIAVTGAESNGAPVVYDAHEFSPLEREDHLLWKLFYSPMIRYIQQCYATHANAVITVCQPIADRYEREFGLKPMIVLNTPRFVDVPHHPVNPDRIQLIHHGSAQADRKQEYMIEAMAHTDTRFHLNMMLVEQQPGYLGKLKQLAKRVAPDRVTFHEPVAPPDIVSTIARFDIGLALMTATNYNNYMALPNKFFEAVNAGLAVLVGQSPAMIDLIERYGFGIVAKGFTPQDIATALNRLTVDDITRMRAAARKAAITFNADTQLSQVVDLYARLLHKPPTSSEEK